jgi:murein DD-endopeptidase MepM/ murein hydrolase activator NlpD
MIKLIAPVKGKLLYAPDGIITQKFNDPTTPSDLLAFYKSIGLNGHNGIDFMGSRGEPIYAAHSGKVVYAQDTGSTAGKMIRLQGEGYYTLYMHSDELLVSVGQNVPQGQIIAKMGNSGSGRGLYMSVHCHFGLYPEPLIINNFGGAVDPMPYFTNMLKIIGNRRNNKQYLVGTNGFYTWIYNEPLLEWIHNSGIADKNQVEWQDNFDESKIRETLALIK